MNNGFFYKKTGKIALFCNFSPSPLPCCWQAPNWTYLLSFKGKLISHPTFLESRGFFSIVKADLKEMSWNPPISNRYQPTTKPNLFFHFWDLPSFSPHFILWNIFPDLHLKSWHFFSWLFYKAYVFPKRLHNPALSQKVYCLLKLVSIHIAQFPLPDGSRPWVSSRSTASSGFGQVGFAFVLCA